MCSSSLYKPRQKKTSNKDDIIIFKVERNVGRMIAPNGIKKSSKAWKANTEITRHFISWWKPAITSQSSTYLTLKYSYIMWFVVLTGYIHHETITRIITHIKLRGPLPPPQIETWSIPRLKHLHARLLLLSDLTNSFGERSTEAADEKLLLTTSYILIINIQNI